MNNSILVYASREGHRLIGQAISQVDRPLRQVAIEATFAEVTLNDALTHDVQFYLSSQNLGGLSVFNSIARSPISQVLPGFNFVLGSQASPHVVLDALHNVTDVKILSTPGHLPCSIIRRPR